MRRPKRLIAVVLFLFLLFAVFELTAFRAHFNLGFLQHTLRDHQASGLLIAVLIFALGNLVQIPGWVFLAAAVLALGQLWGGVVTFYRRLPLVHRHLLHHPFCGRRRTAATG